MRLEGNREPSREEMTSSCSLKLVSSLSITEDSKDDHCFPVCAHLHTPDLREISAHNLGLLAMDNLSVLNNDRQMLPFPASFFPLPTETSQ